MGYFSNGTEGLAYLERYCFRCLHGQDEHNQGEPCAVWTCHQVFHGPEEIILGELIPRTADGLDNERCRMFLPAPEPPGGWPYLIWTTEDKLKNQEPKKSGICGDCGHTRDEHGTAPCRLTDCDCCDYRETTAAPDVTGPPNPGLNVVPQSIIRGNS